MIRRLIRIYTFQAQRLALIFLLLGAFISTIYAQSSEYEIKAVAFEKLSLFIEWPDSAFRHNNDEFIIVVLGKNPFGKILDQVYSDYKIKNRKVKLQYIRNADQIPDCQLLFIPETSKKEIKNIIERTKTKAILTIAEFPGSTEEGCFINFYDYNSKLRFEINQRAMESQGFRIDYKLLSISKIVNTGV